MGLVDDAKDAASAAAEAKAAEAAYEEGGYPGLFNYKMLRSYMTVKDACCCA